MPPATTEAKKETVDAASTVTIDMDFEADEDDLVIYDENDQLALILDSTNQSASTEALESRGYKIQYSKSPEHAVHKMKFAHFHFVALHENFGNLFSARPKSKNWFPQQRLIFQGG